MPASRGAGAPSSAGSWCSIPFGENGRFASGHYNPLDELDRKSKEVIDETGTIAQALVFYSGMGDPHWSAAAQAVVRALILMVLSLEGKYRNLVSVRQLLMLTHPLLVNRRRGRCCRKRRRCSA